MSVKRSINIATNSRSDQQANSQHDKSITCVEFARAPFDLRSGLPSMPSGLARSATENEPCLRSLLDGEATALEPLPLLLLLPAEAPGATRNSNGFGCVRTCPAKR